MKTSTRVILIAVGVLLLARKARASNGPSAIVESRMLVDDVIVRRIDPRAKRGFADALRPAMLDGDITTVPRVAAFLAQILHETGGFQFMRELASGEAYEGRKDLGNTQPGDGPRYKGRGFIQLTGRANYRAAGAALGLPLEAQPELAERADVAARTAVWFWTNKRLNAKADAGDFVGITRAINGGTNGLADRTRLYEAALRVFGSAPTV